MRVLPDGTFYEAKVVLKEEKSTMIPVTIESAGRTGTTCAPHALHDSLIYVAGDFEVFGGTYKKDKKTGLSSYALYIEQLKKWCLSEWSHPNVQAICAYLEKATLIHDLVEEKVLFAPKNQLIQKWNKECEDEFGEKPVLFSVLPDSQFGTFIRFTVYNPKTIAEESWNDSSLIKAYTDYYRQQLPAAGLDYVTGQQLPLTENHPSKLRYGGDMAKLISGNDKKNFTFRGRFSEKNQVATISYEASQKGHNLLKWLIEKQGYSFDERVFLVWGTAQLDMPSPEKDTMTIITSIFPNEAEDEPSDTTAFYFAERFQQAIQGYQKNLIHAAPITILTLDAATRGRMGVLYYQTMPHEDYFNRLNYWHSTCFWRHTYGIRKKRHYTFWGAPSLKDIAKAAYGYREDKELKKLLKNTIAQLFTCVVDGRPLPRNIVQSIFQRVVHPMGMENWEWQKIVTIACAVMNKQFNFKKGERNVAIDQSETDRNYLFGRMLAIADVLEAKALNQVGIKRSTNAMRYMHAFSAHPVTTWQIIRQNILPYQQRLGKKAYYYQRKWEEIANQIDSNE